MVTVSPTTSACLLLLLCCCLSGNLYIRCDAGSTAVLRAINCSTAGNYTPADAYATNLNLLLAALPESTVDKNGGFFNGTAGSPGAPGTAYVLALCAADFTRADCRDCLVAAAASNDSSGLLSQCPGSTTVAAAYDQCLVHYSDAGFLGSPYMDIVYKWRVNSKDTGEKLTMPTYRKIIDVLMPALATLNEQAANTPERFATVQTDPFALVQCTWDLPPDKCKACLDLLAQPNNLYIPPIERKTYSCRLWVSNASFAVFPLKRGALTSSPPSTPLMTPDAGSSPPSNNNNDKDVAKYKDCPGSGNVSTTSSDAYQLNLRQFLDVLPSNVLKNGGFFNGTTGSENKVFGTAMCQADIPWPDQCKKCLQAASAGAPKDCPVSNSASVAYQGCVLRYSDKPILAEEASNSIAFYTQNQAATVPDTTAFQKTRQDLLTDLARAAVSSPMMIGSGNRTFNSTHSLYGLAQCNKDLPRGLCSTYIQSVQPDAEWSEGVSITGFNFYIRYDLTPFVVYVPTPVKDAGPSQLETAGEGPPSSNDKRNSNKAIIAGVTTSGAVLVIVGGVVFCCWKRPGSGNKRPNKAQKGKDDEDVTSSPVPLMNSMAPVFNINTNANNAGIHHNNNNNNNNVPAAGPTSSSPGEPESDGDEAPSEGGSPECMEWKYLKKITKNFSQSQLIGSGTFGKVYLGVKDKGEKIAVKQLPITQLNGDYEEFKKELIIVRGLKDRNIVKLLGYCYENKGKLVNHDGQEILAHNIFIALCFEYMEKGSLKEHLHDESGGMEWHIRYKIIKGTCNGLQYLHHGKDDPIWHLDLKPANILLGKTYVPKIADFGISKLILDNRTQATTSFTATWRYSPPEYRKGRIFSNKYDIFSLGVVMMEIIAGTKGYDNIDNNEFIDQVQENWRKKIEPQEYESVKRCIEIALTCLHDDREKRPEIKDIVRMLSETENNANKLATTSTSQNGT